MTKVSRESTLKNQSPLLQEVYEYLVQLFNFTKGTGQFGSDFSDYLLFDNVLSLP
jgi:hypothetical protein